VVGCRSPCSTRLHVGGGGAGLTDSVASFENATRNSRPRGVVRTVQEIETYSRGESSSNGTECGRVGDRWVMDSGAVLDRVLILRLCHGQEWCCDSLSVPVRIVGEVNGRQTARSSSMQTAETRGCWAFLGSLSQISAFSVGRPWEN